MRLKTEAWVLVTDGEKFLLLRNNGDEDYLDLRVLGHAEIDNPPSSEQGTDRPGRLPDAGVGSSAVDDTDWHALEKERFAADLADRLRHWALADRFSSLLLIADPRSLGVLRQELHKEVQSRLVGEIDKDLTNMPIDKIEKHVNSA